MARSKQKLLQIQQKCILPYNTYLAFALQSQTVRSKFFARECSFNPNKKLRAYH